MFETYQICPYTGLRSFTEEESLYFKGREDDIDQATGQLQRNKFLMLTGASGDGKSSLIYAGIIPNARSGFLKSKYSAWCIADFRPERTPFHNLCKSVARELDIVNPSTVQAELNHGFSALVDLYKNSKRFIDTNTIAWQQANDAGKAAMRREAANLIILVDQFEEFFTNPENYQQGAPSKDANLVLNILLETARIALEEDLPIYIVFTMRSDYTGQCAAFRGLPEYIGFSQFFVPRLNRSQLQLVIEEPAVLSGNQIARRLTERLIHDLTEGVDQLPILQHALNQIWVAADYGNEEMDLIHYAMVGGMSVNELPDEQVARFNEWFSALSPEIKACYHAPSLQNVLDTHTNKLYQQASNYYKEKTGKTISDEDTKTIIRTSFTCLTKIDQSRAVRNRMTLQEITNILHNPSFDTKLVGDVLNIFREPGNTFIHPFISEEKPDSKDLQPTQVLDITHESLIRNWQYLGQWAREEFDSRSVSIDFEQQVGRWVSSDKSNAFLLSIGPLTYFENWYKKAKPNEWWIARYLPEDADKETRLAKATEMLNNSNEFLGRSASKHVITRTLMRLGTRKIAIALSIIALITLTSFVARDYFRKQNSFVLNSIHEQTLRLTANPKVVLGFNVQVICEQLKLGSTTIDEVIRSIPDTLQKINIANGIAEILILQGNDKPKYEIAKSLSVTDSILESLPIPIDNPTRLSSLLKDINYYRVTLELAYYYNPDTLIGNLRNRNAERAAHWFSKIIQAQPKEFDNIQDLSLALENGINYQVFSEGEIKSFIGILSPFENGLQSDWLKSNFNKDKLLDRGSNTNYGFKFNGLFQELAYLYAASGNSERALQCLDTLLLYSQNNFQGDYASGADNATNIAAVYLRNKKTDQLDVFVKGYCARKKISEEEFYGRLVARTVPSVSNALSLNLYWWMYGKQNLNMMYLSRSGLSFFFDKYRKVILLTIKDSSEKNFLLALSYKNEGVLKSINKEKPVHGELSVTDLFDQSLLYYNRTGSSYLEQSITAIATSSADELKASRKFLFLYPDLRTSFHPLEPRTFFYFYFSDVFMEYILNKQLLSSLYSGQDELNYLSLWLSDYNAKNFSLSSFAASKIRYEVLKKLADELGERKDAPSSEMNLLYLYLGRYAQQAGDTSSMLNYYTKVQVNKIFNLLHVKEFDGQINDQSFRLIAFAVIGLSKTGHLDQSSQFISMFKNPINRSSLYAFAANQLLHEHYEGNLIRQYMDSAKVELSRAENISEGQPNRQVYAQSLVMKSPSDNVSEAYKVIRNIPDKSMAVRNICRAYAFHGELHKAQSVIPAVVSDSDLANFLWFFLYGYEEGKAILPKEWENFSEKYYSRQSLFIKYINENS